MASAPATSAPDRPPTRLRLRLSLRLAMQAAVATLGLVLIGVLGATAHGSWRSHAAAEQARDRMRAAAALGDAIGAALSERQFTMNALARPTPLAPAGQADIQRWRSRVDRGVTEGLPAMTAMAAAMPQPALRERLEGLAPTLQRERASADRMLAVPATARDAATIRSYSAESRRAVESAAASWLHLVGHTAAADAAMVRHGDLMVLAWRLRDQAGLARSHVSTLLGGTPATPTMLSEIKQYRSTASLLWTQIVDLAGSGAVTAAETKAIEDARLAYFGVSGLELLAFQIVAAAEAGRPLPVELPRWLASTDQVFEKVLDMLSAAAGAATAIADARADRAWASLLTDLALAVAGLLVALSASIFVARRVSGPLGVMSGVVGRLSTGDTALSVPFTARGDEIGTLARAMEVFRGRMAENEALRAAQERDRAAAERAQVEALRTMAETVERETRNAIGTIEERMAQVGRDADAMADSAALAQENGAGAAEAVVAARQGTQAVAAATEELSASIREIAGQMAQTAALTRESVEGTEGGTRTIEGLAAAVGRIGAVAKLIGDIAAKTNLLALNATIEAARLAGEVKTLASQTARSTDEISRQIQEVQVQTEKAVAAVAGISGKVAALEAIATGVAAAIEQQSAATQEISRSVAGTAAAADEMATRVERVGAESRATGTLAQALRTVAAEATQGVAEVREVLVRTVRTATVAVDRRQHPRHPLEEEASLQVDGGSPQTVRLHDLGAGGAALADAGAAAPGTPARLRIAGVPEVLETRVVETGRDGLLRLAFTPAAAASPGLARRLALMDPDHHAMAA